MLKLSQEEKIAYAFIAPAIIILVILVAYPTLLSFYLSMTNTRVGTIGSFIGFKNFSSILKTRVFRTAIKNSFVFTVSSVIMKLILGFLLSLLLLRFQGRKVLRGLILLPWIVPPALSTLGWKWMYHPTFSVINWVLKHLGIINQNISWLGDPQMAMLSVIQVNIWKGIPFFAINFLAGLVAIPSELYEAAEIDGVNVFQKMLYITIPLMKPVIFTTLLFSTLMTISDFETVYILTGGGPMDSTHLLATYAYQIALMVGDLGRGAAISLFLFPILIFVAYLQIKLIREKI